MDYGIIPEGKISAASTRLEMKVEIIGVLNEAVVFSVDGKEVIVPRDIEMGQFENGYDMTQHFSVSGAKYSEGKSPAEPAVRNAIAKYITDEFTASKASFSVNND